MEDILYRRDGVAQEVGGWIDTVSTLPSISSVSSIIQKFCSRVQHSITPVFVSRLPSSGAQRIRHFVVSRPNAISMRIRHCEKVEVEHMVSFWTSLSFSRITVLNHVF